MPIPLVVAGNRPMRLSTRDLKTRRGVHQIADTVIPQHVKRDGVPKAPQILQRRQGVADQRIAACWPAGVRYVKRPPSMACAGESPWDSASTTAWRSAQTAVCTSSIH